MTMSRMLAGLATCALALLPVVLPGAASAAGNRLFFLHNSTGRNILVDGEARPYLAAAGAAKSASYRLWDHDYNRIGLTDPDGDAQGYGFGVPDDNTDPDGLHRLWTTDNAARDSILSRFDVIAFKSCYEPTNQIRSDAQLQQYKDWYLEIRAVLDQHPDKTFVIMSPPPLLPLLTNPEQSSRARAFAAWLGSDEFLSGHPNLRFFDLFDRLATADDGAAAANTLRPEYTRTGGPIDNHPNALACRTVAPHLMDAMMAAAGGGLAAVAPPANLRLLGNRPNPFNPLTAIGFVLDRRATVTVEIHDLRGRLVRALGGATLPVGEHALTWDGRDRAGRSVVSGVYHYRVRAGRTVLGGRMTLLR